MIVAEAVLFTTAVCSRPRRSFRPFVIAPAPAVSLLTDTGNKFVASTATLEDLVRIDMSAIAGVSDVTAVRRGDTFHVMVRLSSMEYSVREKLYSKELELITEFPDLRFDIDLIPETVNIKIRA